MTEEEFNLMDRGSSALSFPRRRETKIDSRLRGKDKKSAERQTE